MKRACLAALLLFWLGGVAPSEAAGEGGAAKGRRGVARIADAGVPSGHVDAGVAADSEDSDPGQLSARPDAGPVPAAVVETPFPASEPELGVWRGRLLSLLWMALVLFVALRLSHGLAARALKGRGVAEAVLGRIWPLLEGGAWLLFVIFGVLGGSGSRTSLALVLLLGVMLFVIAMLWNPLRDVSAGLVFALERPFEVGDFVSIDGFEGQVRRLLPRVIEIETAEGRRVQVPYRSTSGPTAVRHGGAKAAHGVRVSVTLPSGADPSTTLSSLVELALSSPWAVLGLMPHVSLDTPESGAPVVTIEAYAFDRDAKTHLHADLVNGWREMVRRAGERKERPAAPG